MVLRFDVFVWRVGALIVLYSVGTICTLIHKDVRGNLSISDIYSLESILEWYNEEESNVAKFVEVIKRKNGMSLRNIDWLVTNFSKVHSVAINSSGLPRDLNRDYQMNLSAYKKKNMDPFASRNKIMIRVFGREERSSTIGQLIFFRWYYKNGINVYHE